MNAEHEELMTPAEVATAMRVDPKTVTRWAQAGRLRSIRTVGGHRRFYAAEVRAIMTPGSPQQAEIEARAMQQSIKPRAEAA